MWFPIRVLGTRLAASCLSCASMLIAGCASGSPQGIALLSGTSGPVSWEVVDVSQAGDPGWEIRWSYTLILRSAGAAIQFDTLETGTEGRSVEGGVNKQPFAERLEAKGRLLINGSYAIQWGAFSGPTFENPDGVQIFYRLSGKDAAGAPVRVDVRFRLDRGTGTRETKPRSAPVSTGPSRRDPAPIGRDNDPSSGTERFAYERLGKNATALEEALLEDLRDGRLDHHSELDAALIVSGARDRSELDSLRRRFAEATASSVKRAAGLTAPRERAATLLAALHPSRTTESPLLREYASDATTLVDVIETGRYNCVSATIVFLLLARRSGLDGSAVLLPSHARAVVRIGGMRVPVEATHAFGFDPGEAELREIRRRFRVDVNVGPSYSDESETEVDLLALLGAIYTNVATYRSLQGDTSMALALARRADAFVAPAERVLLHRVRVGLLNETAITSMRLGRYEEAASALREATRLPVEDDTRTFLTETLTGVGLAWLDEIGPSADEAAVLTFSDRFSEWVAVRNEVHSFALRLLADRRTRRGEWELARADLQQAATLTRTTQHRDMIARELAGVELRYVNDLASSDIERAWQLFAALPHDADENDENSTFRRAVAQRLVVGHAWYLVEQERCEELDHSLALWRELDGQNDPDRMRANCHGRRGVRLWKIGEVDQAADELRRAYRLAPKEPPTEHNLVGVLQVLVDGRIRAGRCPEARPLIVEGLALAPDDPWFRRAATACASSP